MEQKKDNSQELFPIVDEEGRVVGKATRGECHSGTHLLHPVVHLHVFNSQGDIYLQRRPEWKDIQPGKWDTAVGGQSLRERELVYVHRTIYDGPIQPSQDELDGGRFWSLLEIRDAIGQGILTPNFESEFQRFFLSLQQ